MNKAEIKRIVADHTSWREWGLQFGWKCYGTNGADSAGFHREGDAYQFPFNITKGMRYDIDRALTEAKSEAPNEF